MVSRLVLGCGGLGHDIVDRMADERGSLHVVSDDRSRVTALRDESIRATEADPADPAGYPDETDVVVVAGDDPGQNRRAVRAARERFPGAMVVAYAGVEPDESDRAAIAEVADRTIDPVATLVSAVLDVAVGEAAERTRRLLDVLRRLDGPLAVVTHDNPDPDAIASAIALSRIAEHVGVDADACYFGEISHQENRALVNLLDLSLRSLPPGEDLSDYGGIALVDHSRPGVNDGLSPDTTVDVVVDHHPPRAPVEGSFVDLRSDVGATSTLLAEYFDRFGIEPDRTVATALLYGIRIDTKDFSREVSRQDFEAAAFLLSTADESVLERVETPSMSAEVIETLARAIRNRDQRGSALTSCVGRTRDRDALAQAADVLLDMEGVTAVVVYGFMDGTVYASGRARGADLDLGETMRDAFEPIGSAGGHADMAGAQISLGILGEIGPEAHDSLASVVEDIVSERFFEALRDAPSPPRHEGVEELAYEFERPASDGSDD